MPNPNPALLPSPALFDVTTVKQTSAEGTIARVALEHLQVAPNPRTDISQDSIATLAGLLMRTGQLIPCIGHRRDPDQPTVIIYDGQRRLLAARTSQQLAGTDGYEGLAAVQSLIVLLVDHAPSDDEIRRIQAQANQREALSLSDQQQQFADCWHARAGLSEQHRIAAVCADLGVSPKKAHNLRRQLTLPDTIRQRVADRPAGGQISIGMASRLADMHDIAPQLTEAVAARITSPELHDKASRDLGAFVHRTIVEDEHAYAIRIDDGAILDAAEQVDRARAHLSPSGHKSLAQILDREDTQVDKQLDQLAGTARHRALKIHITPEIRDRARAGRFAYIHHRGQDFADSIWVISPLFMIELCHNQLAAHTGDKPAKDEAYFAGAKLADEELQSVGQADRERRSAERKRQAEAANRNIGLGHDLRAGLIDPTPTQLQALKAIICRLLAEHYRELIAYGAGWTDEESQRPVGDTGRREPRQADQIVSGELQRALEDPDPLRGIAQLTARWAASFVLDPDGIPRTKPLGTERMSRKLADAIPGGDNPLRAAVWEFIRPMLSPHMTDLNRDQFLFDHATDTTVNLAQHRADSDLNDLDLDLDRPTT